MPFFFHIYLSVFLIEVLIVVLDEFFGGNVLTSRFIKLVLGKHKRHEKCEFLNPLIKMLVSFVQKSLSFIDYWAIKSYSVKMVFVLDSR